MNLSPSQIEALDHGEVISFAVGGREYVVVSRDSYERDIGRPDESLDADELYRLIDDAMLDDDANDPGLESYQQDR